MANRGAAEQSSNGVGEGGGFVPRGEVRDIFIPTDPERTRLLELVQSPQESLESIARDLNITLAALTVYLASDDAIPHLAQAELANARRARIAASAQLEQCVGALSLIINDFISDVTHNLQRETPKSRREQDRQKETTRRAATVLYRIANFTPKVLLAPPLPAKRGEVPESARAVRGPDAQAAHPASNPPAISIPVPLTISAPRPPKPPHPTSAIPHPKSEIPRTSPQSHAPIPGSAPHSPRPLLATASPACSAGSAPSISLPSPGAPPWTSAALPP